MFKGHVSILKSSEQNKVHVEISVMFGTEEFSNTQHNTINMMGHLREPKRGHLGLGMRVMNSCEESEEDC